MVHTDFLAAGGNRHPSSADWAPGLLAFGAGNNIALWDPQDSRQNGIYALLTGHSDAVNVVKIWDHAGQQIIFSGGADKTVRVWTRKTQAAGSFEQEYCLEEHNGSINAIALLPKQGLIVTGSADGTAKVWHFKNAGQAPTCVQSITLKARLIPLALGLTSLGGQQTVLAVAGTASHIQILARSQADAQFELQANLTGHEGWIRSLDFASDGSDHGDLLLASASQDKFIRLWRFRLESSHAQRTSLNGEIDAINAVTQHVSLSNKTHSIGLGDQTYSVTFEALLVGHEDWIYTARWAPSANEASGSLRLLSASADNSLAIWSADTVSGVWVCTARLGEISAQKGSTTATGSTGGFWIGLWQPDGTAVTSLGRTGSWRRWAADEAQGRWTQSLGIGGHVDEIRGVGWAPKGEYLLSTSSDQTTRLWSEWKREGAHSWHEMSRPQIHGYDLNCIDSLRADQFISGADEKLLRVFDKPRAVDALLARLSGSNTTANNHLPDAANMPVLGLSNKAISARAEAAPSKDGGDVDGSEAEGVDEASEANKAMFELTHPPFEDHLARHTLWPEHEKLYGHGYEICAVAASHDGTVVASACKASSIDHAVIRLFEQKGWRALPTPLSSHSLTVTSLAFAADDRFLLSVGRDRQWAIFERQAGEMPTYAAFAANPKGHSRMILDCSWAPLITGRVFATASRDKSVKVWKIGETGVECAATIAAPAAVTAVAFELTAQPDRLRLVYGTDEGHVGLVCLAAESLHVDSDTPITRTANKSVTALAWRPPGRHTEAATPQLAVGSDDGALRILAIPSQEEYTGRR